MDWVLQNIGKGKQQKNKRQGNSRIVRNHANRPKNKRRCQLLHMVYF